MQVLVYDAHSDDREFLDAAGGEHTFSYTAAALDAQTAALAQGFPAICCFPWAIMRHTPLWTTSTDASRAIRSSWTAAFFSKIQSL